MLRASFLSHQSQGDVQRFIYSLASPLHSLKLHQIQATWEVEVEVEVGVGVGVGIGRSGVGVGGSTNPSTTQRALREGQAGVMGFLFFQNLLF